MNANIVFVKWGNKYSAKHVNVLVDALRSQDEYDLSFYCYTEDPDRIYENVTILEIPEDNTLKVWWNKLALFKQGTLPDEEETIYIDLDVRIDDAECFITSVLEYYEHIANGDLAVIDAPHKREELYNRPHSYDVDFHSSVMYWIPGRIAKAGIWETFDTSQRDYFLRKYKGIDRFFAHEMDLQLVKMENIAHSEKWDGPRQKYDLKSITTFEELDYEV